MTRSLIVAGILIAAVALAAGTGAQTDEQDREADHEALRAIRRTVVEAINSKNIDLLIPLLHDSFSITMVDQGHVTSVEELKQYFHQRFDAEGTILESMKIEPKADVLTVFVSDDVGFNYGSSSDTYTLKSGREVVLDSRWTATLVKGDDGWKLVGLHAGVNMLDNPILAATEWKKYLWGGGGLLVGALVAVLGLLRRRPR